MWFSNECVNEMKISIITVCYNSNDFIEQAISSVVSQNYHDMEYIIIDGGSEDGTVQTIKRHKKYVDKFISERDEGLYDAMNKGIKISSGDIVGILNSDDMYYDEDVIGKIANKFSSSDVDSCYGDIVYVDRFSPERVKRYWKSGDYSRNRFIKGWMPPHPAFFVKRKCYEKFGLYNTDFIIASDYELMLRFLFKHGISSCYIPSVLVRMRTGGASTPGLLTTLNNVCENYKAWRVNELHAPCYTFFLKPLSKIPQLLFKKDE